MNTQKHTVLAGAVALALATAATSAAPSVQVTGSLIPHRLETVVVRTPSMAFIRAIAIKPLVRPLAAGRCEVTGAVYSDNAAVADGPMPHVQTALIGRDGQRVAVRTNYMGVYVATVRAGTWREARPDVGELPFGVHPSRPRIECD